MQVRPTKVIRSKTLGRATIHMVGEGCWEWRTAGVTYTFRRVYVPARKINKHFWTTPRGEGRDTLRLAVIATMRDHRAAQALCRMFNGIRG